VSLAKEQLEENNKTLKKDLIELHELNETLKIQLQTLTYEIKEVDKTLPDLEHSTTIDFD
jgi:prefoldin subunit 5